MRSGGGEGHAHGAVAEQRGDRFEPGVPAKVMPERRGRGHRPPRRRSMTLGFRLSHRTSARQPCAYRRRSVLASDHLGIVIGDRLTAEARTREPGHAIFLAFTGALGVEYRSHIAIGRPESDGLRVGHPDPPVGARRSKCGDGAGARNTGKALNCGFVEPERRIELLTFSLRGRRSAD